MNEDTLFGIGGMIFLLVLLVPVAVVSVWQGFKTWQTKITSSAEIARDEVYRKLAEETVSAQQSMLENQQQMAKELSEMKDRIYFIEKMLRDIE